MKRLLIISGFVFIFFVTCKSTVNHSKNSNCDNSLSKTILSQRDIKLDDILIKKNVDTTETFLIKDNCLFIIQMTTKESNALETIDPDSYEVISENANNVSMSILELVERLKIKNYWSDKRYVKFSSMGKDYLVDTRLYDDVVGQYCILFSHSRTPELVRMDLINEDKLNNYFKK